MGSPGPGQNFDRSPSENARPAPVTTVPIAVTGLAIVLSLVVGLIAGTAYSRYSASRGRPQRLAPASATPATAQPVAVNQLVSLQPVANGRFEVREVDFRLVDSHPEITILLSQPIDYDAHRLDQPDRVYIDLHDAHLARELKGATISINKGGVSRVRLAQTQSDTVRVVLDLEKRFDYAVVAQAEPAALRVKLTPWVLRAKPHHAGQSPRKTSP